MEIEINRLYLLALGFVLLAIVVLVELYVPERVYEQNLKKRSYLTNVILFGFNNLIFFTFQITSIYLVAYNFRLNNIFDTFPFWIQAIAGILILDCMIWVWHLANHKIPLLWRFHKCHHSEQYLNATSAIRFHIGELLLSVLFKSVVLIVFGISFWVFVLYESLITLFAIFHHANMHLPHRFQDVLSWLIITPDMHRTHHSSVRVEHDSNYGVIFSWWDRLLRTYQKVEPEVIGLQYAPEKNFYNFLLFPFRK